MTSSLGPGWYDDPEDPSAQRYWDGQSWTEHRQPKPPPAYPAPTYPAGAYPTPAYPTPGYPASPYGSAPPPAPGMYTPGVPPRRSQTPMIIGAVGAVVVLAAAGVLLYFFVFKDNGSSSNNRSSSSHSSSSSPEDQIKDVLQSYADDINNADPADMSALFCEEVNKDTRNKTPAELREQKQEKGTLSLSVQKVDVSGDNATATVSATWSKSPSDNETGTVPFVKEKGSWKMCGSGMG
jgi:hypothetical protein